LRAAENADSDIRERVRRLSRRGASQQEYRIWSVLREMYRREASQLEDLVYGALPLLGVSVPASAIKYGIGLRGALMVLVDAMHVDQWLLLTVVEAYRDNTWIDSYRALPSFRNDNMTVFAPMLNHLRTLGTAAFTGHSGIVITAPSFQADLYLVDDGTTERNLQSVLIDHLEDDGDMNIGTLIQVVSERTRGGHVLSRISPAAATLGLGYIAVTEVDPPPADNNLWKEPQSGVGEPLTTFFCIVCQDEGNTLRKVGVAVV